MKENEQWKFGSSAREVGRERQTVRERKREVGRKMGERNG